MNVLESKRVFITGGANGIGREIVKAFSKEGAKVCFCDTDQTRGHLLVNDLKENHCEFISLDVRNSAALVKEMEQLLDNWGDLDIIINNVGVSHFNSILDTSIEEFEEILDINLRSVFITAKVLAQHRAKKAGDTFPIYGRIINMASTRYLMSEPDSEGYAASKGGIVSLTHALALSLSSFKITVNCISPGWIETKNYEALRPIDHLQHPSQRVGIPADIARMCLFLCHPDNDFINGQNFIIDGGMTKKMIYEE